MVDRAKLERCLKLRTEADKAEERLKTLIPRISARIGSYHTKSVYGRPTEELATERVTLEELLTKIVQEYAALTDEISTACQDVDPTYREIIMERYIDGLPFQQIAEKMHYSDSYIYQLHRNALAAVCGDK